MNLRVRKVTWPSDMIAVLMWVSSERAPAMEVVVYVREQIVDVGLRRFHGLAWSVQVILDFRS